MYSWMADEQMRRLALWGQGFRAPPAYIDMLFTRHCPFSCRFCNAQIIMAPRRQAGYREMSDERLVLLAREAASLGVLWWGLFGGEPTTNIDRLIRFIRSVRENGMNGFLVTNGSGWNEESLQQAVLHGWAVIAFSLYSHSPKIHDAMVGHPGAFAHIVKAIETINKFKKQFKRTRPVVNLNSVITSSNYLKLDRMVSYFAKLGIKNFNFLDLFNHPPEADDLALDASCMPAFQDSVERVLETCAKYEVNSNIGVYRDARLLENKKVEYSSDGNPECTGAFPSTFCFDPWRTLVVDAAGGIRSCRGTLLPDMRYERDGDLEHAWYEGPIAALRRNLLADQPPEICRSCCTAAYVENRQIRAKLLELRRDWLTKAALCGDSDERVTV